MYCLIKFNHINFCPRLSYASLGVCAVAMVGVFIATFCYNFSNDKIDLNGRLLYFGAISKINLGNFSLLL